MGLHYPADARGPPEVAGELRGGTARSRQAGPGGGGAGPSAAPGTGPGRPHRLMDGQGGDRPFATGFRINHRPRALKLCAKDKISRSDGWERPGAGRRVKPVITTRPGGTRRGARHGPQPAKNVPVRPASQLCGSCRKRRAPREVMSPNSGRLASVPGPAETQAAEWRVSVVRRLPSAVCRLSPPSLVDKRCNFRHRAAYRSPAGDRGRGRHRANLKSTTIASGVDETSRATGTSQPTVCLWCCHAGGFYDPSESGADRSHKGSHLAFLPFADNYATLRHRERTLVCNIPYLIVSGRPLYGTIR